MRDDKKKRPRPPEFVETCVEPAFDNSLGEARMYREGRKLVGEKVFALQDDRRTMLAYIDLMRRREDWHGVGDAAADLREIDAKLAALR